MEGICRISSTCRCFINVGGYRCIRVIEGGRKRVFRGESC